MFEIGHKYIGTEHMLLDLVREGERVGAQTLVNPRVDLARVRQTVIMLGRRDEAPGGTVTGLARRVSPSFGSPGAAKLVACSFCGSEPPESGQLVSGTDAFICEHCVRRWSAQLESNQIAEAGGN